MEYRHYRDLLRTARRFSRRPEEAEDLLHATLLVALEAGRSATSQENRRWMAGVLRKQAALTARAAIRARQRETAWQDSQAPAAPEPAGTPWSAIATLPPALRVVALLALSGHTRGEIRHLLRLSDDALRQRLSQLRQRWAHLVSDGQTTVSAAHPVASFLAFGAIRSALLPLMRHGGAHSGGAHLARAHLASHDPDGHLFAIGAHRSPGAGNCASSNEAKRKP